MTDRYQGLRMAGRLIAKVVAWSCGVLAGICILALLLVGG